MMAEKEIRLANGWLFIPVFFALFPVALVLIIMQHEKLLDAGLHAAVFAIPLILLWLLGLAGFIVVNPNEARVITLFGKYAGTVKDSGLYYGNPFYKAQKVSQRVLTLETGQTKTPPVKDAAGKVLQEAQTKRAPSKVNDKDGTPIEIAAIVVWKVINTAEAVFMVDNFEEYVQMQSEAALRNLATQYRYDSPEGEFSLRSNIEEIAERLKYEVQQRVSQAGVEIIEARISHLAYAPEIAAAMLQRQQAGAIIAARAQIVDGAVGMVEHALELLAQKKVMELTDERKAAMVSNLLVVLCSHSVPQPVISAGTH
ncbi:MAG: SPFH domain-containing protein [Zavarzinella sp.]